MRRQGFTMLETVMATSVMALVVVAAMGSWLLFMHKSNRANNQASLDLDARKVVERFRHEMRNAARETIMFYPLNEPPYKGIGFALAKDTDNDGLMDMDASGSNILWRQTVVYHVYERSPTQMRRTVFSNRNTGAGYDDFYQQLGKTVTSGSGAGACLPGETAETFVLFENLFTGKLWHAESVFDGYAAEPNTLDRVTFGSLSLGPGEHTVTLTAQGKNPKSTGKRIRLDQLTGGVAGWPLEAELRETSGAAAQPLFVGQGLVGAAYGMDAAVSADGESITLKVLNDAIEECGFIGKGRNVALSNTVVRFDASYQPAGFGQGVYVAKLDGEYAPAWAAGAQTAGTRSDYYYPTNCAIRIPVMGNWVARDGFGPVFRVYKSLYNGGLEVIKPVYAVVPTPAGGAAPPPDLIDGKFEPLVFYQDGVEKPDWASCDVQKYLELRPRETARLELNTTLLLAFEVRVANYGPNKDRFTVFDVKRPGVPGCWIIPGGDSLTARKPTWSGDPDLVQLDKLPSLEALAVGFADGGDYVSHPFDTRSTAGKPKTISWEAEVPAGAAMAVYARSGNLLSADGFAILDAPDWASAAPAANGGSLSGYGRYVQFRTAFVSAAGAAFPGETAAGAGGPYRVASPRLRRVLITWDGDRQYVDVVANLLKGPDCGMFKVEVDGKPLIRGVTMEIEIFKDIVTQGGVKTERIRSAMMAEIEPRNSTKK